MQFPEFVDLTCRRITELAGAYMAHSGLTTEQRVRFEQHLHACTWCMTYVRGLDQTVRAAAQLAAAGAAPEPDTAPLLSLFRSATRSFPPPTTEPALASVDEPPPREVEQPSGVVATTVAFKFLARDAIGPLSGHVWSKPAPGRVGDWLCVEGRLIPSLNGVHACRADGLAHWLHDELWMVELDEPADESGEALIARRGRLLCEVTAWSAGGALRFAASAHDRAAAMVADAGLPDADARRCLAAVEHFNAKGDVAMTAYCAAMAVARLAGVDHFDQQAFDRERRWQSAWIAEALDLDALRAEAEVRRAH